MTNGPVAQNEMTPEIQALFNVGAHFAYTKTRRHPSAKDFIFGVKNRVEIFDLEKTVEALKEAKKVVSAIAEQGGMILFVGGKSEAREAIKRGAESVDMPFVAGRWIGGTLTNYSEIRGRVERMEDLMSKKEKGELAKYTKRERLIIDREIETLKEMFSGLSRMKSIPKAMFIIDIKREHNALAEAAALKVPVITLSNSDCDFSQAQTVVPANDASVKSINYFVDQIVEAYKAGAAKKKTA